MTKLEQYAPILREISQYEVDFVIPRAGVDIPIGIDPFLLYKSRDPKLSDLHTSIITAFNYGISLVAEAQLDTARSFFTYPEVPEIGLGYTKGSKKGSGVGEYLAELIVETLLDSPVLVQRGVRHIEEMQLVSVGIGPDRVSDIAANLLKEFLIGYTQRQCALWEIPLTNDVPTTHIFDPSSQSWYDGYFDLPISPLDGSAILLVPRRIVRTLPWINYDDYFKMEFSTYLRAKRVKGRLRVHKVTTPSPRKIDKEEVVAVNRREIERIDRYIASKEESAALALPSSNYISKEETCPEVDNLKQRLEGVRVGQGDAAKFQRIVLEMLNTLFSPELIDGELEVRTIDGTERRDIIFTNDSDKSFWAFLRTEHSSIVVMFETKNVDAVSNDDINQTAAYLGDRIGRLGFIVTRNAVANPQQRKINAIYNDSQPRKIILVLNQEDLIAMLDMKCEGKDPMKYIQKLYRKFRTQVQ